MFGFRRILPFALGLTFASASGLATAQTVDNKPEVKAEILKRIEEILTTQAYVPNIDFSKWTSFLEAERKKLDDAKNDDEFGQAVNEALRKFGASHVFLGTPRMEEQRRTSKVVGIGITSMQTPDGLLITRVVAGASAEKAGMVPGDVIIEVEGKKPVGTSGIPGVEGTDVHLKVKRDDASVKAFTLTRKPFSTVRKEELAWLNPETAKVAVYTFDRVYDRENVDKLFEEAYKAKNIVLDLRDNGGGLVFNLQHLLSKFIDPSKAVGTFINRSVVDKYKAETKKPDVDVNEVAAWSRKDPRFARQQVLPLKLASSQQFKGNVVVLVNQGSGSASEMCAAALKELDGARIIGTKSAGAVLVSVIPRINYNFTMQYPISDYVTVRGLRIEGHGIEPDVTADVRARIPGKPDVAVDKALMLLHRMGSPDTGQGR